MEWIRSGHHGVSDPWRVSSLVSAFLEVVVALCVLLCAVVSVATTKLVEAAKVLPRCHSCDARSSVGMGIHDSGPRPGAHCRPRIGRGPANPMRVELDDRCCASACDCSDDRRILRLEDSQGGLCCGGGSDGEAIGGYDAPKLSPSSGRPIKRKFSEVSPSEAMASPSKASTAAHGFSKAASFAGEKTHAEIPNERFASEESSDSSQESFSYSWRAADAPRPGGGGCAGLSIDVSIDSDLLAGEVTPESDAGAACPGNWGALGVQELRAALEEKDALAALYVELEEERSAASGAAREAMAMITRLQEEKAAAQMEARQYRREAEERLLYDQEALAVLEDALYRREEQLCALEEEVGVYRRRLTTVMAGGVGSPEIGREILLMERETAMAAAAAEGSEDWSKEAESGDERLLADIREWQRASIEKALPAAAAGAEALDMATTGRGSSAGAGYESFEGMMASLRREPGLRDEESLETLKEIEEKFRRRSSEELAASGDELRQIWKTTLRSFESGERAAESPSARPASAAQEDRSIDEKRLSVLEYVWKFEEQLHQARKAAKFEGSSEFSPRASSECDQRSDFRPKSIKTRLRRLAAAARGAASRGGSPVVHDVCEVKRAVQESVQQTAKSDRSGLGVKSVVSCAGPEAVGRLEAYHQGEEFLDDDRLGKPDFLPSQACAEPGETENQAPVGVGREEEEEEENAGLFRSAAAKRAPPRLRTEDVVRQLTHRLQSLETDQQVMRQTIGSLRKENGEVKLLQEIAQQFGELRELKQPAVVSADPSWRSVGRPVVPSIKDGASVPWRWRSWSLPWRAAAYPALSPASQITSF